MKIVARSSWHENRARLRKNRAIVHENSARKSCTIIVHDSNRDFEPLPIHEPPFQTSLFQTSLFHIEEFSSFAHFIGDLEVWHSLFRDPSSIFVPLSSTLTLKLWRLNITLGYCYTTERVRLKRDLIITTRCWLVFPSGWVTIRLVMLHDSCTIAHLDKGILMNQM